MLYDPLLNNWGRWDNPTILICEPRVGTHTSLIDISKVTLPAWLLLRTSGYQTLIRHTGLTRVWKRQQQFTEAHGTGAGIVQYMCHTRKPSGPAWFY